MVYLSKQKSYWNINYDRLFNRVRTHGELCNIFIDLHPERKPISRSTVNKNLKKTWRPCAVTNEVIKQNIAIDLEDSPQTSSTILTLYTMV